MGGSLIGRKPETVRGSITLITKEWKGKVRQRDVDVTSLGTKSSTKQKQILKTIMN